MRYFNHLPMIGLLALALTACGGSGSDNETLTPRADKPVLNEVVMDNTSTEAAPETVAPADVNPAQADMSAVFVDLPAPYNTADYAQGKRVFRLCSSCHVIGDGSSHRVGPDLQGVFDRKIGTAPGFSYSRAVQEADFEWTPEQLEQWLASPRSFLPGNRMSFQGVRKPVDRTAVIAYLMIETATDAE